LVAVDADVGECRLPEPGIVDQDVRKPDAERIHRREHILRKIAAVKRDAVGPKSGWADGPMILDSDIRRSAGGLVHGQKRIGPQVLVMTVAEPAVNAVIVREVVIDSNVILVAG